MFQDQDQLQKAEQQLLLRIWQISLLRLLSMKMMVGRISGHRGGCDGHQMPHHPRPRRHWGSGSNSGLPPGSLRVSGEGWRRVGVAVCGDDVAAVIVVEAEIVGGGDQLGMRHPQHPPLVVVAVVDDPFGHRDGGSRKKWKWSRVIGDHTAGA